MNILFIRPYYGINVNGDMGGDLGIVDYSSQITPDLSIIYSASLAKKYGITVDVRDCNAEKKYVKELLATLQGKKYEYIIVKAAAPSVKLDIKLCRILKRLGIGDRIVLAGHVAKILKEWIVENVSEIDEVPDTSMENYVFRNILKQNRDVCMNDFPVPCYADFPFDTYNDGERKIGYLWSSKGCNLRCSYCPYYFFYGKKIDNRDISMVIDDIQYMISLGINYIQFRDPFFTNNRQRILELCNTIIDKNIQFEWFCETRIDTIDAEVAEAMYRAGCRCVAFGVENADLEILKKYSRPVYELKKAIGNVEILKQYGIKTLAFYMVGFPEDTYESVTDTYKIAEKINTDYAQFNVFTLYSDTEMYSTKVTPDFFIPCENMTNINACKALSRGELVNIVEVFRANYSFMRLGLRHCIKEKEQGMLLKKRAVSIFNNQSQILDSIWNIKE